MENPNLRMVHHISNLLPRHLARTIIETQKLSFGCAFSFKIEWLSTSCQQKLFSSCQTSPFVLLNLVDFKINFWISRFTLKGCFQSLSLQLLFSFPHRFPTPSFTQHFFLSFVQISQKFQVLIRKYVSVFKCHEHSKWLKKNSIARSFQHGWKE